MQLDEIAKKTYRGQRFGSYEDIKFQARLAVHQAVQAMAQLIATENPTSSKHHQKSTAVDIIMDEINHTNFLETPKRRDDET